MAESSQQQEAAATGGTFEFGCRPRSMIDIDEQMRTRMLETIKEAERVQGFPGVNQIHLWAVWRRLYGEDQFPANYYPVAMSLQNLYREDLYYADDKFTVYSMTKNTELGRGFELFSERFRTNIPPGYVLDERMRIRAAPGSTLLNLDQLTAALLSKNEEEWATNQWMFEGHCKYLDGTANTTRKIAFTSFPRSGNTFLRKYLELLTCVNTGGDNNLDFNVNLQMLGSVGEEITDDTVWVVKTHYPWIPPDPTPNYANQLLIVVRNPLDSLVSWLDYLMVGSQSSKLSFDCATEYPEKWDRWVRFFVPKLKAFYTLLIDHARARKSPTVFIRFEDLLTNPGPSLESLMKFLLLKTDLEGTYAQERIRQVLEKGQSATQRYDIKERSRKLNPNFSKYTAEQIDLIKTELKDILLFFGYGKVADDPDNATGFFDYTGDAETSSQDPNYMGFKKANQDLIEWSSELSEVDLEQLKFPLLVEELKVDLLGDLVPMFDMCTQHYDKMLYGQEASNP